MKIRVFQIDHEKDEKNLAFRDYQTALAKNGRIDESIYKQVYGGEVPCRTLEEVYSLCNGENKPLGYIAESMSVSNVIEVTDDVNHCCFYVDSVGFKMVDFDTSKADRSDMMRILILENEKVPYEAEISHDIHAMQNVVDGSIEPITSKPTVTNKVTTTTKADTEPTATTKVTTTTKAVVTTKVTTTRTPTTTTAKPVTTTKATTTTKTTTTTTVTTPSGPVITDDTLYVYWYNISDRLDDPILDWTKVTFQIGSFIDEGIAYSDLYNIGRTFGGTDYEKAVAVCEYAYNLGGNNCIEYALNAYFLGKGAGIDITIARSSKYDWYGHVANTIKLDGKWYYMESQGNIVGSPYTYAAGGNGISYPNGLDITTDIYERNVSVTIADDWYK